MGADIFAELHSLFQQKRILSLYGKSGTGKTSFALFFICNSMTESKPFQTQCVWIQASELFPIRRLNQLYNNDIERLHYTRQNLFISPLSHPFLSYKEQSEYFSEIEEKIFPPKLRFIAVDNISHHLRFEISNYVSVSEKIKILNKFYETQILPLVLFCQINNLILILIHEVSYNPSLEKIVPFFHKLYSRLKCIEIELKNDQITAQNFLSLKYLNFQKQVKYQIHEREIEFEEEI